jgi:hypothetical protein
MSFESVKSRPYASVVSDVFSQGLTAIDCKVLHRGILAILSVHTIRHRIKALLRIGVNPSEQFSKAIPLNAFVVESLEKSR